jgi:hypothetical protein
MAVSGSQKTRIGIGPAVGIKITITAKADGGGGGLTVLNFGRGLMRSMSRGTKR